MQLAKLMSRIGDHADSRINVRGTDGGVLSKRYADFREDIERAAAHLRRLGLREGLRLGLYADNSYQWMVLDLACIELGIFLTAFGDDTFRNESMEEIFRHYDLALLFTDKPLDNTGKRPVRDLGEILAGGRPRPAAAGFAPSRPVPEDHFSLSFSSGSTGIPKGIIVSRAGAEFLITAFVRAFGISSADGLYLFLPLSNFQQRLLVYAALYTGADITLTVNDYLLNDLQLFAPTFFVAPPVLFKNILKLFDLQRESGESLRALLGGNIRFMLVGMAPAEARVIREFHDQGVLLLESYGLSESGVIAWNTPQRCKIGTVGMPLDAREVAFSSEHEVLVRRRSPLCLGYFDSADEDRAEQQTFRPDGVIATGDLGCMDEDGYLVLTGRKKNVVVTASGHKYQPEPVESKINLLPKVNSSIVYHSQDRQCNVAIINIDGPADRDAVAGLQAAIDRLNESLSDYQRIGKILVNGDAYTIENQLLTANMKLNRARIIEKYSTV